MADGIAGDGTVLQARRVGAMRGAYRRPCRVLPRKTSPARHRVEPVAFSSVIEQAERVAIVGTGESLKGFDLVFGGDVTVIAINGAIRLLPRTDVWFTLDPSRRNREIMARPRPGVTYYAAVPEDYGMPSAESPAMREPADTHVRYLRRIEGDGSGRYRTKHGLCPDKGAVHTGNSGWGAFQVARHMGARRIALFGIDGRGRYVSGGTPRQLSMVPGLFASAVSELLSNDVAVVNGSWISTVTCFSRMGPEEARAWLQGR